MSTRENNVYQAYVINDDGTKTAVPMTFADAASRASGTSSNPFFKNSDGSRAKGVFSGLHLGRRVAGLALIAVGIPMLILPGPGLLCISVGAGMLLMP